MNIENAKYVRSDISNEVKGIIATIDGEITSIPLIVGNRHYNEIMRLVDAGTLTIADAD